MLPSSLPRHIRDRLQHPNQPMDQPELAGYIVGIRWSDERQAFELQLGSSAAWYHQDELERAD